MCACTLTLQVVGQGSEATLLADGKRNTECNTCIVSSVYCRQELQPLVGKGAGHGASAQDKTSHGIKTDIVVSRAVHTDQVVLVMGTENL